MRIYDDVEKKLAERGSCGSAAQRRFDAITTEPRKFAKTKYRAIANLQQNKPPANQTRKEIPLETTE